MRSKLLLLIASVFLCLSSPIWADDSPIMRVIVVQTDNASAYIKEVLETGRAHMKRIGAVGQLRAWKAKFAGHDAGSVVISIEYPSLTALAEDDKKLSADSVMGSWIRDLDKIRKIVSDSLYQESKL